MLNCLKIHKLIKLTIACNIFRVSCRERADCRIDHLFDQPDAHSLKDIILGPFLNE